MRLRKKPWVDKELVVNDKLVHDPYKLKGNWHQYFGNALPIHLELGCGKGQFIIETARQNPFVNFIAVERQSTVIAAAARNASKADINLALINIDVKELSDVFGINEISRLYINFCDPWPNKKKWAKRRLTHVNMLDQYEALLNSEGTIFFKTDNQKLFEFSINQFSERGWIMRNISLDLHKSGMADNVVTEYEHKYSERGNPIYRLEASVRVH